MMRFYDTASCSIRDFVPIQKGEVRIYSCGPSVYAPSHLGNFRTYVFEDAVKRTLRFLGYQVFHVMNITDVEDKAVRASKGSRRGMRDICLANEKEFRRTCSELSIIPADLYPRATENIPFMIRLIKKLMKKKLAYRNGNGDVYFDVSRFRTYGRFSHSRFTNGLDRKVTKDDYYQREAGDFLLWKAWRKADGDIFWRTSLGNGRPGWHIECSAMSARFLGVPFDIHEGGVDNIFSHHENEIAQTKGALGKIPARYWIHVRHLLVEGKKMSKSLGNICTVVDMSNKNCSRAAIRAHLLRTHYRRKLNFTFKGQRDAENDLRHCKKCLSALRTIHNGQENPDADLLTRRTLASFRLYISNDFDFPSAIDVFCSFVRKVHGLIEKRKFGIGNAKKAMAALKSMDSVLGLSLFNHGV